MLLTSVVRLLTDVPVASNEPPSAANTSELSDVTSEATEANIPDAGTAGSALLSAGV